MKQNWDFLLFEHESFIEQTTKKPSLKLFLTGWGVLIAYFICLTIGMVYYFVINGPAWRDYLNVLFTGVLSLSTIFSFLFVIFQERAQRMKKLKAEQDYQANCWYNLKELIKQLEFYYLYFKNIVYKDDDSIYKKHLAKFKVERAVYLEIAKREKIADTNLNKRKNELIFLRIISETVVIPKITEIKKIITKYQESSKNLNQFNKSNKKWLIFYNYQHEQIKKRLMLFDDLYKMLMDASYIIAWLKKNKVVDKHRSLSNWLELKKNQLRLFIIRFSDESCAILVAEAKKELTNWIKTLANLIIEDRQNAGRYRKLAETTGQTTT